MSRRRQGLIRRLVIVLSAIAAVLLASLWLNWRRYALQFVGHWGAPKSEGEFVQADLPVTAGLSLFEDGTGLRRYGPPFYIPPFRVRWWASGSEIRVQHLGTSGWSDELDVLTWQWSRWTDGLTQTGLVEPFRIVRTVEGRIELTAVDQGLTFQPMRLPVLPEDRDLAR